MNLTASFAEVTGDPSINAIVLALPVGIHYKFAKKAPEAGKHLMVEKPLCTATAETDDLIEIANKKKLVKMAVYDEVSADAKIQICDKGIDKKNMKEDMGSYDDFGKFQLIQRAGDLLVPKINFIAPLRVETRNFVECITDGVTPITGGDNGRQVVKVLDAAQKSLKGGGDYIEIEN